MKWRRFFCRGVQFTGLGSVRDTSGMAWVYTCALVEGGYWSLMCVFVWDTHMCGERCRVERGQLVMVCFPVEVCLGEGLEGMVHGREMQIIVGVWKMHKEI